MINITTKRRIAIPIVLILVMVSASFLSSLKNGFVSWDDDVYVMNNQLIKELSWSNIGKIFASPQENLCKPLVFLFFALEYHFFKLDPFFYHLTNLLFHLANCLLVFWFIFLITDKLGISFITALLFGIHPLQVESVAWVFQLKNMLAGFFFLWALILYLYYCSWRLRKYYYLALLSFLLSLLSKPMGIALPLVLLCLDYLKGRRLKFDAYLDKIPFVCICVGITIMSLMFSGLSVNSRGESLKSFLSLPYQIIFYLSKAFSPLKLSCLYPDPSKLEALQLSSLVFSPLALLILAVAVLFSRRYTRKIIFGSLFFLLLLFPVLVSHTYEAMYIVADHFTYLALIGIFYLAAEGFFWLLRQRTASFPVIRVSLILVFLLVVGTLSFMTYQKTKAWKDSFSLWDNAIKNYPNVAAAYHNRGVILLTRKEYDRAAADFRQAIALQPNATDSYIALCGLYIAKGDYSSAIALGNRFIASYPTDARLYANLGRAYIELGKTQEAKAILMKALSLNPDDLYVYYGLADIYAKQGDIAKALDYYAQAIAKNPYSIDTYTRLIGLQAKLGNHQEIIKLCEKILQLDSRCAQAYCNLGRAYSLLGDFRTSIRYSLQALKYDPKLALAHTNLAVAYYYTQQYPQAVEHCDRAIQLGAKIDPDFLKLLQAYR
jgi:tetratricopeptide (TPR) repeat protein